MKIAEVKIGFEFEHRTKGKCRVIAKTKRTITIVHNLGVTKTTYRYSDATFSPSDF